MPLLFSYGTLQRPDVQRSTFGRPLHGTPDALPRFAPGVVEIHDPGEAAEVGATHYANVVYTGAADNRVPGTVFEVTDEDLAAADEFERPAQYARERLTLASGRSAWVYVYRPGAQR